MSGKKVWLVTGAARGLGVDIARAALAAGHAVVATGRDPQRVARALGDAEDLLSVKLDVTDPADAQAAVQAAVETNLFGPVNVTRAVLPLMRAQCSGLVVTVSSTAGLSGQEFVSAYAASKFAVEGWMESLTPEVTPFGIRTMLVEPGFFRTELLSQDSTRYAELSIDDYVERTAQTVTAWTGMDGKQGGDPVKLAAALVQLAGQDEPPVRFAAGADALGVFEHKAADLLAQADAHRELSSSLAHDDAAA